MKVRRKFVLSDFVRTTCCRYLRGVLLAERKFHLQNVVNIFSNGFLDRGIIVIPHLSARAVPL